MKARITGPLVAAATALLVALAFAAPALAAPANDDIVNAQVLPAALPVSVPATTIGATGQAGEKVFSNEANESVWFAWTPAASGPAVIDLCTAGFSGGSVGPGMGVYTGGGPNFADLTKVTDTNGPCKLKFNAVAGTAYKLQVDYLHAQGDFTFTLRAPQPPANDNFASAQSLGNAVTVTVGGSTIDATWEAGEPAGLGGSSDSRSVWYSWTSPVSGQVQLNVCPFQTQPGSPANKTVGVYTGATLATLAKVVETNSCTVEFKVTATVKYRIAFSGSISGEGTFTLGLREATPPGNDNLGKAVTLGPGLPVAVQGDNSFATIEAGESALLISGLTGATHSLWYQWTPSVSERVKLNACPADHRARLGVFTGNTIATVAVATEPQSRSPYCAVELSAAAGTTYKIVIAGDTFDNSAGPFELEIHQVTRPANDNFAAATAIGPELPIAIDGTNRDATIETGEVGPGEKTQPIATVWYRWDASFSGPVDIGTCGSAAPVFAAVHVGSAFAAMKTIVPEEEEGPGPCVSPMEPGARERFTAVARTTYWIQVSSPSIGREGSFHLTIADPNPNPKPTPPAPPASSPLDTTPIRTVPAKALTLKQAIAQCAKKFPGQGKKAKAKRARCIVQAKRRFALANCRKITVPAQQQKCVAAVRKRFS